MNKIKGYFLLSVFVAPFVLLIGMPLIDLFKELPFEAFLWFIVGCFVFVSWIMAGHYGMKYLHSSLNSKIGSK